MPLHDEEFEVSPARDMLRSIRSSRNENAADRMDTLAPILYEVGHTAGFNHVDDGIMFAMSNVGIRRLPTHSKRPPATRAESGYLV